MDSSYVLDAADTIVATEGGWDAFADACDSPRARGRHLIGTSIWSHVSDFQTSHYLGVLFRACRTSGRPLSLPYRCDSEAEPRLFTMTIHPRPDGGLTVTHRPEPLGVLAKDFLPDRPGKVSRAVRCSVCCAFEVEGDWIDAFGYPDERFFPSGQTICPTCRMVAEMMICRIVPGGGDRAD